MPACHTDASPLPSRLDRSTIKRGEEVHYQPLRLGITRARAGHLLSLHRQLKTKQFIECESYSTYPHRHSIPTSDTNARNGTHQSTNQRPNGRRPLAKTEPTNGPNKPSTSTCDQQQLAITARRQPPPQKTDRRFRRQMTNCNGGGQCGTCAVQVDKADGWDPRSDWEANKLKVKKRRASAMRRSFSSIYFL